ncbi:unnamed protein product [Euphydryas editha]|uniref:Uncharacterized protein n=1 Tax=Euphydryas editha TaxID=104508 RepID=A0AAU9TPU3_EUPED|nr:unnamed protein product [Euphydryas editha]
MAHVRSVKESGNALWGARRVRSAARKYRKCLRFLEHVRDRLRAAKKPRDSCEYCTVLYVSADGARALGEGERERAVGRAPRALRRAQVPQVSALPRARARPPARRQEAARLV